MQSLLYDFSKGFIFGATLTAIPGPIFFLIIQRTLTEGVLTGLSCGLGSIAGSTLYAALIGIGMSWVLQYMLAYKLWITFFGSFFLMYLGITTYRQKAQHTFNVSEQGLIGAACSTFLLTLVNPVTILTYCLFFAEFGTEDHSNTGLWTMTVGIALGSTVIVLLLVGAMKLFMRKISVANLGVVNKFAGFILFCFGIAALFKVIIKNVMK